MLTRIADSEDVLSATLAQLRLTALAASTLDAAGRWAIEFAAVPLLRLQVVLAGECRLSIAGEKRVHHLRAGDCVLLPHAKGHTIASDAAVKRAVPAQRLIAQAQHAPDGVIRIVCNGGGDYLAAGCGFQLDGHFQQIVFGRLPSLIHVPAHAEQAAVLRWGVERFGAEVRNRHAGRALMLSHLAPILLLQLLRSYLATAGAEKNWFVALGEPRLAKALAAMQSQPARAWSLDTLARVAGLSRAGFALNFKKWVGVTPMEYLTQWRMQLACRLLQQDRRIAEVASAVGYESESAFSVAFTRIVRVRPGSYRRRRTDAA